MTAHSTERGSGSPAEPLCGQQGRHSVRGALDEGVRSKSSERQRALRVGGTRSRCLPRLPPPGPARCRQDQLRSRTHVPPGGPLLHPDKAPGPPESLQGQGLRNRAASAPQNHRAAAELVCPRRKETSRAPQPAFPFPGETPGSLLRGQERNALAELADWLGERSGRSEH